MSIIITSPFYDHQGHYKNYTDLLSNLDKSLNIKIVNLAHKNKDEQNLIYHQIKCHLSKYSDPSNLKNFFISPRYLSKLLKFFFHSYYLFKLKKIIKNTKNLKFVYFLDYEHFSLIFFLILNKKLKYYICIHSTNTSGSLFYRLYKKLFFKFLDKNRKNFLGIITNSEDMRLNLIKKFNNFDNIYTVQFPVEIPKISINHIEKHKIKQDLLLPSNKRIILVFGLLRKEKNYDLSFKILKKLENDFHMIIAGSESSVKRQDLLNIAKVYNVKNFTILCDYFDEKDISTFYSISDIFLFNYNHSFHSQSGPVSISRQFKLPVIAYKNSYVGKYIKSSNYGIVSDTYDEDGFAQSIISFFKDENQRKYIQNKFENSIKFSSNETLSNYRKIFS